MVAYIIHPKINQREDTLAIQFYERCYDELSNHIPTTTIQTNEVLESITLQVDDVVIFFNRCDQNYSDEFLSLLEDAVTIGSELVPIALVKEDRKPPLSVNHIQSADVTEQLRQRNLLVSQIETVATSIARNVISKIQPTLTKNNMYLFLSHRRFDGEEISGAFYNQLILREQEAFRDLNKVFIGEDAQEVIEENLRKCDAVVFLDTPRSGESEWIAIELKTALSRGLPIVWVRIGPEEGRAEDYFIKLADKPHFHLPDLDPKVGEIDSDVVDKVIHKAFEISREHAKEVLGHLRRIRKLEKDGIIGLTELDKKYITYQIDIPRPRLRYSQRPMTHIISFYGRIPQEGDHMQFLQRLESYGYTPHPRIGQLYDSALLLAPIATQYDEDLLVEPHRVDSIDEYINTLENVFRSPEKKSLSKKKGVIISGAFPDCESEYQQRITDAVRSFVQAILTRGNKVIFGAHPTFQHLIFDMAKQIRSEDYQSAVHMYVSKYFVNEPFIEESENYATVFPIDEVKKNRSDSLTKMRQAMIDDHDAICMVVIGGKTNRPGIPPGIDEEIEIAISSQIPVFLIGSAGGRTAEIAAEMEANKWVGDLNGFSPEFNHELMVSLDYSALANDILNKMGL